MLIDTHAHIHFQDYRGEIDQVLARAHAAGVEKILCVGVDDEDSAQAIAVARAYQNIYATVGLHPHDADRGYPALEEIARLATEYPDIVMAIGECGLDNFKSETSPEDQERALRFQIELALQQNIPLVLHVREAFPDLFRILDDYHGVRGLVHCFTAGLAELEGSLERGLFIALNGIMTFTKDPHQLEAAQAVPLDRLVLETDCPFLTPVPHRGHRNEPAHLALTAQFLAGLRHENLQDLAAATTQNARALFSI